MKFNTVEEARDELRAGKIILVTDDAVSYTHLDVYKRQEERYKRFRKF